MDEAVTTFGIDSNENIVDDVVTSQNVENVTNENVTKETNPSIQKRLSSDKASKESKRLERPKIPLTKDQEMQCLKIWDLRKSMPNFAMRVLFELAPNEELDGKNLEWEEKPSIDKKYLDIVLESLNCL